MTGGPSAGPTSAYATLRTPASICLSEPNAVFAAGTLLSPGCACGAEEAAAMVVDFRGHLGLVHGMNPVGCPRLAHHRTSGGSAARQWLELAQHRGQQFRDSRVDMHCPLHHGRWRFRV